MSPRFSSPPSEAQGPGLEGTWRGTLDTGAGALRLVLRIEKSSDGLYTGLLDSVDQGSKIPIASVTQTGDTVKLDVKAVAGTFEGTLNASRTEIKGTWNQGAPLPLVFIRDSSAAAATGSAPAAPAATDASAPSPPSGFRLTAADSRPHGARDVLGTTAELSRARAHVTNVSNRDF